MGAYLKAGPDLSHEERVAYYKAIRRIQLLQAVCVALGLLAVLALLLEIR